MSEVVHQVFERSCKRCHGPDGHGIAGVAPDLHRAPRRSAAEWERYLRDPKSRHPNSPMPAPVGLGDEELKAVAAYLANLTQANWSPRKSSK
jgi:mono/diheme cytochrome c family protein